MLPQPSSLPRTRASTSRNRAVEKVTQAAPVDPGRVRVARLGQLPVGDDDRGEADRHVEQEDRLPAEAVGQQAADQRPDRDGDPDRRSVYAHRHAAFGAAGELLGDEGEGDGEHDRAADALQAAGEVEEGRVGREAAEQRGERRRSRGRSRRRGGGRAGRPASRRSAPAQPARARRRRSPTAGR